VKFIAETARIIACF